MAGRAAAYAMAGGGIAMVWDTEVYDYGGYWDPAAPTRLTIPAGEGGLYQVGHCIVSTTNINGNRWLTYVTKNGGADALRGSRQEVSGSFVGNSVTCDHVFAAGDYVQAFMYTPSEASLDLASAAFWIRKIGVPT